MSEVQNYRQLTALAERTREGYLSVFDAGHQALSLGYLLAGTAVSMEVREPRLPLTTTIHPDGSEDQTVNRRWRVMDLTSGHRCLPVVRLSGVVQTTVLSALGGDVNHTRQRLALGRELFSDENRFHLGTHGWKYDANELTLKMHARYAQAIENIPDDQVIGAMDFTKVPRDMPRIEFETEPGHFGVTGAVETIASTPVRMADVRRLTIGDLASINYELLPE